MECGLFHGYKEEGRLAGYYGTLSIEGKSKQLAVIGPYEKPTGGADCVTPLSRVFEEVKKEYEDSFNVIFEGLLISRSKGRTIDLWEHMGRKDLHIIHLTTPLELCLLSIEERRRARGNKKPVDPARTSETFNRVLKITKDLEQIGIPVTYCGRELVLGTILNLLRGQWQL